MKKPLVKLLADFAKHTAVHVAGTAAYYSGGAWAATAYEVLMPNIRPHVTTGGVLLASAATGLTILAAAQCRRLRRDCAKLKADLAAQSGKGAEEIATLRAALAGSERAKATALAEIASEQARFEVRTSAHARLAATAGQVATLQLPPLPNTRLRSSLTIPGSCQPKLNQMVEATVEMLSGTSPTPLQLSAYLLGHNTSEMFTTIAQIEPAHSTTQFARLKRLHRKGPTLDALRKGFALGRPALLIGENLPDWSLFRRDWSPTDRCMLVGGIFTERCDAKTAQAIPSGLEWVLVVSSPVPLAFGPQTLHLMNATLQHFAVPLNILARTTLPTIKGETHLFPGTSEATKSA